ncbi:2,3-bisphosphoglycerate-dependent phosphoglycerate mutase [Betaproteobacteria bacterium SCN1]|jgi:2,3-bisphosphoglycerate-dependent phosphoglycerate mutase|nr:2,3-bisphosphoglycerate-dependent phosphoglycerate mutase [Betaproteobacteria bacterium SCN1]MBN8760562.1 2,3-bisphosphoglycerate-dependent phosphoglycerate mutase [Thiobacillus sp.]ODU88101.1 MAG: phosphoglyceromutase [Thiobacillus sp. SCN 65-179]OJW36349.1 MAG: phosphoglyceromutase [Thiobacillus sp. 65-69]
MKLVLLRHGHSEWNLADRFTGWTDIPLTGIGLDEARWAGRALARAGFGFDAAHVSVLQRTRQTAEAVLAAMDAPDVPVRATWRLNERHYGALQGLAKQAIFATWGEAASRRWWRGYAEAPPPLASDDPRHPRFDPRYAGMNPADLPASESLRDCQRRTLPYWENVLLPALRAGQRLLVVSHGNTLRGLIMHLDGLSAEAMEAVEIPSGVPCVYDFDDAGRVRTRVWLDVAETGSAAG